MKTLTAQGALAAFQLAKYLLAFHRTGLLQKRLDQIDQFELQIEKLKILGQSQRREAEEKVELSQKLQQTL